MLIARSGKEAKGDLRKSCRAGAGALPLEVKLAFVHHHMARLPDGINELSRRPRERESKGGIN